MNKSPIVKLVLITAAFTSLISLILVMYDLFSLNNIITKIPLQLSKVVDTYEIEVGLMSQTKEIQSYLLTGEDEYLKDFLAISGKTAHSLDQLVDVVRDARKPLARDIKEKNLKYVGFINEQVVPLVRDGRRSEASALFSKDAYGLSDYSELFPLLEELQEMRLADTYSLSNSIFSFSKKTAGTVFFTFMLIISLSVAVIAIVKKSVYDNLIFRLVVSHSHNAVITFDTRGQINSVNLVAEDVFGIPLQKTTGKNFKEVFTGKEAENEVALTLPVEEVLSTGKAICSEEKAFIEPGGWVTSLLIDCFPLRHGGKTMGAVIIARDISHSKVLEEQLRRAAVRDGLTNLYNHKYLMERLVMEVTAADKSGLPLSLLLLDIDNFKHCNDNYGHLYGDQVLRLFAGIINSVVRSSDIVGRYGGDEFAVILPGSDLHSAREIGERIRKAVQEYDFPQKELLPSGRLTVSIGIAVFPDNTRESYGLIKLADEALYEAKRSSKNKVEIYFSALKEFQKELQGSDYSVIETAKTLLTVINAKDRYTYSHSEKVVYCTGVIAGALGFPDDEVRKIKLAAFLHDVGKIEISQEILNKPDPLSESEWKIIKKHSEWGAEILRPFEGLKSIIPIVLYHHERYDGKGYPNGLTGEEIPLGSRIITVADAFDAMSTNRPYRKAKTTKESIEELIKGRGSQFDPLIVNVFVGEIEKKS